MPNARKVFSFLEPTPEVGKAYLQKFLQNLRVGYMRAGWPVQTFNREPTLSATAKVFLIFLNFPFKDLTQNQECYWPNSDPKSQPLCMGLL